MRILSRVLSILLVALLALAGTSALADETSEAVEIAKSVYAQATEHEKEVTSKLQSLETDSAKLVGLDFRQKSEESIARKILLDAHDMEISLEEAGKNIHDALRYTFCIEDSEYISRMDSILKTLTADGYSVMKFKNFWGLEGYQGVNVQLTLPDGFYFELQFHTADSYDAKENKAHPLYEIIRREDATVEEITENVLKMNEIYAAVPVPEGIRDYVWPN